MKLPSILDDLNPEQQQAVTFGKGPLMILAGAGSGKTRVLTHRTAWLISQGTNPENILLLTFTNKAAEEMKKRLVELLGTKKDQLPFAGTFHSFCARILHIDGHQIDILPNFTIYDSQDQIDAVKEALDRLGINPKEVKPALALSIISEAKNELISPSEYPELARGKLQQQVARVYAIYQQILKESGALDFDDLLIRTLYLFQQQKETLKKYQNKFLWVLVDEYQDTNRVQYLLTQALVKTHHNLTVVGDACQSIYSWRGADYRNLVNLKKDFADLKIINLEQNYRSSQIILEAANEVISKNTSHPILNLWTDNARGEKITIYEARNELDEASFITSQISGQMRLGPMLDYNDFAVLYRTNAQSRVLEEAFLHNGIPYRIFGGIQFYERKEIKDCLAYLRLIANPKDKISYNRIEKIGKGRLEKFLNFVNDNETISKKTTAVILDQVLNITEYLDMFNKKDPSDLARIENIKELKSVATNYPELNQFLENVTLVQSEATAKKADNQGSVSLMTLHNAKGMEFPYVFITGMEEGLFPHSRAMMEKSEMEEERRLCYVGITRAKIKLFLTFSKKRLYFGQFSTNPTSRFLEDIPPMLVNMIGGQHEWDDTINTDDSDF